MFKKICVCCAAQYLTKSHSSIYCPNCRDKKKYKKAEKLPSGLNSINRVLRDCERYNKENKKILSYGQYVSLQYIQAQKKKKA